MTCDECKDDPIEGSCHVCSVKDKQSKPIQKAYRYSDPTDRKTFADLKKDQGSKFITEPGEEEFVLLNFECKMEGSHAVYTFSDFHRNKDVNFFGDRPAVYGFNYYKEGQGVKVYIGQSKNASQRMSKWKTKLKKTTLNKMDKTEGFLLLNCGSGTIEDDPLRSQTQRVEIETLLQINFDISRDEKTKKKRREQHVIPNDEELILALRLSKWVFKDAPSSLKRENETFTTKHS